MPDPKFRIGQFVYWRQDYEHFRRYVEPVLEKGKDKGYVTMGELSFKRPAIMQVVEILIQHCYAGAVQIQYDVRGTDGGLHRFTEPELLDGELAATETKS